MSRGRLFCPASAGAGRCSFGSTVPFQKRTRTTLYNIRPDWLDEAHQQLDEAVCDAYAWPPDLRDSEILAQLLTLNLERVAVQDGRMLSLNQTELVEETGE